MDQLSIEAISKLGFIRYRSVDANFAAEFLSKTGWELPASYVDFLCFREPPEMDLTFVFVNANGDAWEGSLTELCNVEPHGGSLDYLAKQIIQAEPYPGRFFLPIGVDAGGNYLYLDLSKTPPEVVDVDYGTGLVSTVAQDFDTFLQLLKPAE